MHMGQGNNPEHQFTMNGQALAKTTEERDIRVTVTPNLKPAAQCLKAARTAQTVLGQIGRGFHYRDRHTFIKLYKQYVRPHLEFSTQAWSPWSVADKECLEKVQKVHDPTWIEEDQSTSIKYQVICLQTAPHI